MCLENLDNEIVGDESLGEDEDISTDYEYWNMPREIEVSSAYEEECIPVPFPSERAGKWLGGSWSYEDDISGYVFARPGEVGCVKFVRYMHTLGKIKRSIFNKALFKYLTSKPCV